MENNAQSDLLSVVIISAIILAAGITLWVFFSGYALMTRLSAQEEVNKELSVLRSAISADYVICPRGEALIRNVGKEPVVIFRVIVYKNGEMTWDSLREYGVKAFAEIDVNEVSIPPIRFPCPQTREDQSEIGDLVTVQIHYIPKSLFDPSSPELIDPTSDVLLFRIATFQVEKILPKSYQTICPDVPKKWAWIDYINIDDRPPDGELGERINIILPEASDEFSMELEVEVEGASGRTTGRGLITITNASEQTPLWINIEPSELRYPVTIRIRTVSPEDTGVLQRVWYLDAIDNSYVDYVKLLWNYLDGKLIGAYVNVFHEDSGTYEVTVKIFDCNGEEVSTGSSRKDVTIGAAGRWEKYLVYFRSSEFMSNVREIRVFVRDVSETTTTTTTELTTTTETITETLTHWITQPATTVTRTLTTTFTRTFTTPAFTLTITLTNTETAFTTTTATSTLTSTTTTTTTTTTTITTTRTTTRYLTTSTSTATTTRTTVTTSFTTTRIITSTVSVPTATRTLTSTTTITTTVPTATVTSTQTQTTTVVYTPPPSTLTTTQTLTSTVATTTMKTTTTVGTTVTSVTTRTTTITTCPISSSHTSTNIALLLGLLAPVTLTSLIIRRYRK